MTFVNGCRSPARHSQASGDPTATYQDIHNDFLHGNLDVAVQKAEKARTDFSDRSPDWAMKFRLQQAEILAYQGRRRDVVALLNCDDKSHPTSLEIAIKSKLLCGLAHEGLGQGSLADQELHQARFLSDSNHQIMDGEVLQAEAKVELSRDHFTEAAALYRKSLQFAHDHGDPFLEASDLLNLGYVALQMEHYDEAVALLNRAADFARSIQARQVTEAAMGNLGGAYFDLGDYEKALSSFQLAEEQAKEIGTTSAQVDWLWDAGTSYYQLGDFLEAKKCYEQALKAAQDIDNREEIAGINTELAFLLFEQGQFDAAKTHSDAALRAARESGDKSAELEPRFLQALLLARQPNAQQAESLLMQIHSDATDTPSLQWRVENAIADYYEKQGKAKQAEQWYLKSIRTFETQRASVKDEELKLPFFANGDSLYRDYADFLVATQKPGQALQLLDLGRARTLAEGLGTATASAKASSATADPPAVDPQAVARRLHAVILFYSLGPEKSSLWAVTANSTRPFSLPKESEINSRVEHYQKAILRSSDPLREGNDDARSLYELLVAPAAKLIPKNSRVFIIPDGSLNGLNFETLLAPDGNGLHYWIENVTVTNANSILLLSRLDGSSQKSGLKNLLLIGNPIPPSAEYENLPNAPVEIGDIARHFPQDRREVFTQTQAVPAVYAASKPDRFAYIHFVAHGTASRLSPLDSAVVLSAEPKHPDNFKLYARDIVRHRLNADLVTISTCYGSGQRAYAGEGLVGLSWAFLRAGSHNVIGALWQANDASTPLLMDKLYSGLNAGDRPEVALRDAKLSLIHSESVYRKPLYWAAFQLYAGS